MPENLQIGAIVDTAALKAGMDGFAKITEENCAEMSAAFRSLAADSQKSLNILSAEQVKAAEGARAHSLAQTELQRALRAGKAATDDNVGAIARIALAQQAFATDTNTATVAIDREAFSMREARGAMMLAGEEIGVKMNRHVAGFLATLPGVGAAMSAAFSVVAVIGLYEILGRVVEKAVELKERFLDIPPVMLSLPTGMGPFEQKLKQIYDETNRLIIAAKNVNAPSEYAKAATASGEAVKDEVLETARLLNLQHQRNELEQAITGERQRRSAIEAVGAATAGEGSLGFGPHLRGGGLGNDEPFDLEGGETKLGEVSQAITLATANLGKLHAATGKGSADTAAAIKDDAESAAAEAKKAADAAFKMYATIAKAHDDLDKHIEKGQQDQQKSWDNLLKYQLETEKEANDAAIADYDEREKKAHESIQAEVLALEDKRRIAQMDRQMQEVGLRSQAQTGRISPREELEAMKALHQAELAEQANYIRQAIALQATDPLSSPKERQKLEDQLLQIQKKAQLQAAQDDFAILRERERHWRQFSAGLAHDLTTGLNGWLRGQKSFVQSMGEVWNSIAMQAITAIEKIGEEWLLQHVLMRAASVLFHAEDAAAETTAAGVKSVANVSEAMGLAGLAAAGQFAWYSAVAPPIAPEMAAAAYGEGVVWAGMAAFDTGGIVPKTGVALVHQGEGVLTAPTTTMLQKVTAMVNSGPSKGGGHTFNFTIHGATDPKAVSAQVMRQLKTFYGSGGVSGR